MRSSSKANSKLLAAMLLKRTILIYPGIHEPEDYPFHR